MIDISFTITAIIAVVALISPVITTTISNRHQLKLKAADYKFRQSDESILHVRKIIDEFLSNTGELLGSPTLERMAKYRKSYFSAIPYLPDDIVSLMSKIDSEISNQQFETASLQFRELIIPELVHYIRDRNHY